MWCGHQSHSAASFEVLRHDDLWLEEMRLSNVWTSDMQFQKIC